jgi:NADH-quinone oxidoreductase subunit N
MINVPPLFDFIQVAPEIILSLWGLFVVMIDVLILRNRTSVSRGRILGVVSIIGALFALASVFLPEIIDLGHAASNAEESLFQGTLVGGLLVERMTALLLVLLIFVLALSTSWNFTEHWGEYYALVLWATVGMILLIASEELLTLFLTLEMMTICLYIITAFEKDQKRSAEGGLKYFVYGSVSSALFLFGLSLLYGLTGTTRLAGIGIALAPAHTSIGLAGNVAGAMAVLLVLVGFGFKISAVPFHQWAPDAYEGAPAPVAAWLATGSKLASIVALMKVLVQALGPWAHGADDLNSPGWVGIVAIISAVTMTYGNFAALAQKNLKRMLAYSSIAHAGYMLVGVLAVVVATGSASAGPVLFYLVVYSAANIGAFSVAAWLFRDKGSDQIDDLNGLALKYPILGVCVLLLMLSLIGLPGLAGFWGKFFMFSEALSQGEDRHKLTFLWLVALGLMNSVISAFYYVRVLRAMFLRPSTGSPLRPPTFAIRLALIGSTLVVLFFGLYPQPLTNETNEMADSRIFHSGASAVDLVGAIPATVTPKPVAMPVSESRPSSAPPERTAVPTPSSK